MRVPDVSGLSRGAAPLVLCALVGLALGPIVVGRRSFFHIDLFFTLVPYWEFAARTVAEGDFPWWTDLVRAGYPLYANGEASLLHPLVLPLALALPAHRALDAFAIGHLMACAVGAWLYLREVGASRTGAFFGGFAFALSGRMIASTMWPHAVAVSASLPFVLIGIERAERRFVTGTLWIASAVALAMFAARPQRLIPLLLFAAAYSLFAVAGWRAVRALALGAGVGALIGAVQAMPTLLLLGDSGIGGGVGIDEFRQHSLRTTPLAEIFLPAAGMSWPEARMYPGLLVYAGVALAAMRLLRVPQRRVAFLLATIPLCFGLAWAMPGVYELSEAVPVLRGLRSPVRYLFPAAFAAVAVAALALSPLLERRPFLAALACAELVIVVGLTAPTAPAAAYREEPVARGQLAGDRSDETGASRRVFSTSRMITPAEMELPLEQLRRRVAALPPTRNLAMSWGVPAANGSGVPVFEWQRARLANVNTGLLQQLGVDVAFLDRTASAREGVGFDRVADPLPRALCVGELREAEDFGAAGVLAASEPFDRRAAAVVERGRGPSIRSRPGRDCRVRYERDGPSRLRILVEAAAPSFLVVFDTWAPGWQSHIGELGKRGDHAVPIFRANGMFRLVEMPAGRSVLRMRYRPPGLVVGLALSFLGAVVWLALAWRVVGHLSHSE